MLDARRYHFFDQRPDPDSALPEVLAGLRAPQKTVSSKYFYDAEGSRLFEAICELPEYYPTRAELALMQNHVDEIARHVPCGGSLLEFGSGSSRKTLMLIEAAAPACYCPVDISITALEHAAEALLARFGALQVHAVAADFTRPIDLPEALRRLSGERCAYFPGSTIGNLAPEQAVHFLGRFRNWLGPRGRFLVGIDLKKSPAVLHAAYNDAQGLTARFNLNLLNNLNHRFGADFDAACFAHMAYYDADLGRVEMHLRARQCQTVRVAGERIDFAEDETLRTEISCKYDPAEVADLAHAAGYELIESWFDPERRFGLFALRPAVA